jgi:hypothetical protein
MGLRRWVREALGEAPFSGTIFVFPVQSKRNFFPT